MQTEKEQRAAYIGRKWGKVKGREREREREILKHENMPKSMNTCLKLSLKLK